MRKRKKPASITKRSERNGELESCRKGLHGRRGTMDDGQDRKPHQPHAVWICTRGILQAGRDVKFVKATLLPYERRFHREYDIQRIEGHIVYWDVDLQAWRSFQLENFLEWRPIN